MTYLSISCVQVQEDVEPMEVTSSSLPVYSSLTELDSNKDTTEIFLLSLLKSYSRQQLSTKDEESREKPVSISSEALNTLSYDQFQMLVKSKSIDNTMIQQILTQREANGLPVMTMSENKTLEKKELSQATSSSIGEASTLKSPQLQSPISIQITQDQLSVLQQQLTELLCQQSAIPPNLTPQQKQALVQSLLAKPLSLQGGPALSLLQVSVCVGF